MANFKIKYGDNSSEVVKDVKFSEAMKIAMKKSKDKNTAFTVESV